MLELVEFPAGNIALENPFDNNSLRIEDPSRSKNSDDRGWAFWTKNVRGNPLAQMFE